MTEAEIEANINNKSHFGENFEKVVVIDRCSN